MTTCTWIYQIILWRCPGPCVTWGPQPCSTQKYHPLVVSAIMFNDTFTLNYFHKNTRHSEFKNIFFLIKSLKRLSLSSLNTFRLYFVKLLSHFNNSTLNQLYNCKTFLIYTKSYHLFFWNWCISAAVVLITKNLITYL